MENGALINLDELVPFESVEDDKTKPLREGLHIDYIKPMLFSIKTYKQGRFHYYNPERCSFAGSWSAGKFENFKEFKKVEFDTIKQYQECEDGKNKYFGDKSIEKIYEDEFKNLVPFIREREKGKINVSGYSRYTYEYGFRDRCIYGIEDEKVFICNYGREKNLFKQYEEEGKVELIKSKVSDRFKDLLKQKPGKERFFGFK